jgi:hypothetical protein
MQEDKLALIKAVDSGDTDLGKYIHSLKEESRCSPIFRETYIFNYISLPPFLWFNLNYAVYHVLLHLHKRLPLGTFFGLIEDGGASLAPASALLQVYARAQNREMLRDFYYSDDRRVESAILALEEANGMNVILSFSLLDFVEYIVYIMSFFPHLDIGSSE